MHYVRNSTSSFSVVIIIYVLSKMIWVVLNGVHYIHIHILYFIRVKKTNGLLFTLFLTLNRSCCVRQPQSTSRFLFSFHFIIPLHFRSFCFPSAKLKQELQILFVYTIQIPPLYQNQKCFLFVLFLFNKCMLGFCLNVCTFYVPWMWSFFLFVSLFVFPNICVFTNPQPDVEDIDNLARQSEV